MPYYNGKHMSPMEYDSLFHAGLINGGKNNINDRNSRSRPRGTAVVFRDKKVLLVRDKGKTKYSLPGGGANKNEPSMAAAIRELFEELGMSARKAERLFGCDFTGSTNKHKVTLIETDDKPYLKSNELDEFIWWDMKSKLDVYPHVSHIISRLRE